MKKVLMDTHWELVYHTYVCVVMEPMVRVIFACHDLGEELTKLVFLFVRPTKTAVM